MTGPEIDALLAEAFHEVEERIAIALDGRTATPVQERELRAWAQDLVRKDCARVADAPRR